MTNYLAILKARTRENTLPQEPAKPSKAPFGGFGGYPDRAFRNPGTANRRAERAAIMEFDGALPRSIAEGLAKLDTMAPPDGFSPDRWHTAIDIAARLADEWGARALALGWTAEDLFGLVPAAPAARQDGKGLAFVLRPEDRVIAITPDTAMTTTASGARLTYWRNRDPGIAVPAWKLERGVSSASGANQIFGEF